ncbi:MAG: hypothetical protein HOV80_28965 [Polyangiaceae bacterium]|nr:hypothetical protein [Polyangiaceae bacterium]
MKSEGGGESRAIPDQPVADGFLDAASAAQLLRSSDTLLLRLHPPTTEASQKPYGPLPASPIVVRLTRGKRIADVVHGGASDAEINRVDVVTRNVSWGGWGGSPFEKTLATVVVELGGKEHVAALAISPEADRAAASVKPLCDALNELLDGEAASGDAPAAPPLSAPLAGRFALALEGDYVVMRDYESVGPRANVTRYALLCAACLVLAAIAWTAFARELAGAAALASLLGYAAVGFVLGAGALAMGEIARFASKYRADNAALAWFFDDRVVILPWVSREGAIDTQPEGRLGAAIRIPEVDGVSIAEKDGTSTLTLETQHGPIDVFTTKDAGVARAYRSAIERVLVAVAAPAKRPTGILKTAAATT